MQDNSRRAHEADEGEDGVMGIKIPLIPVSPAWENRLRNVLSGRVQIEGAGATTKKAFV
jgi:hypothetical protein